VTSRPDSGWRKKARFNRKTCNGKEKTVRVSGLRKKDMAILSKKGTSKKRNTNDLERGREARRQQCEKKRNHGSRLLGQEV